MGHPLATAVNGEAPQALTPTLANIVPVLGVPPGIQCTGRHQVLGTGHDWVEIWRCRRGVFSACSIRAGSCGGELWWRIRWSCASKSSEGRPACAGELSILLGAEEPLSETEQRGLWELETGNWNPAKERAWRPDATLDVLPTHPQSNYLGCGGAGFLPVG
ncbi:hypothetical protein BGZ61DRAFT_130441 [Ilyonectria robusta]|uniref:uncharacterized protein n=1 Tax=Ilyonectria robusta TaxID=1079257 RepID=UPI001E8DB866|nr:uncharacterized protein BGZ61DRAFT_130441 [Ilyonectria robusta]KAH8734832.1 hypothetical protein BGZ61DRAFT_130441 [Ilyonectria robusta]